MLLIPAFLSLACLVPSTQDAAQPAAASSKEARTADDLQVIERIEGIIREGMKDEACVGLSLAVAIDGKLFYSAGYGMAELEHGVPVNKDTMFRIGSITKQFTAAAICRLAEQDKLYIDDPIQDFVPGFETKGKEITLRHLLTHTSGIFNYTNLGPVWADYKSLDLSREKMISYVAEMPLNFDASLKVTGPSPTTVASTASTR
ncbi:MAG: D-alanyl-D-alanine carboxypeptidase [Planctomycetota bacterium]|jgi:D-alanyl-D-alanine carboxypeptidase